MTMQATSPLVLPTVALTRERERALAAELYLVRIAGNDGLGDTLRCRRCNACHEFLTLNCVPQPFDGAARGVFAYFQTLGASGAATFLDPFQRAHFNRIKTLLGDGPDLATAHPQLARSLGVAERDAHKGAVELGVLVPITRAQAVRYALRIRATGAKFRLPGLTGRELEV